MGVEQWIRSTFTPTLMRQLMELLVKLLSIGLSRKETATKPLLIAI